MAAHLHRLINQFIYLLSIIPFNSNSNDDHNSHDGYKGHNSYDGYDSPTTTMATTATTSTAAIATATATTVTTATATKGTTSTTATTATIAIIVSRGCWPLNIRCLTLYSHDSCNSQVSYNRHNGHDGYSGYCTAHACWDVTGYSNPFRPFKVPICGRLLKGVHKKKSSSRGCPVAKTGLQRGKNRKNSGLLFNLQNPHTPPTYRLVSDRLPA